MYFGSLIFHSHSLTGCHLELNFAWERGKAPSWFLLLFSRWGQSNMNLLDWLAIILWNDFDFELEKLRPQMWLCPYWSLKSHALIVAWEFHTNSSWNGQIVQCLKICFNVLHSHFMEANANSNPLQIFL